MYNFSKRKSLRNCQEWGLCRQCNTLTRKRSLLADCLMCSAACEKIYTERGGALASKAVFEDSGRDFDGSEI